MNWVNIKDRFPQINKAVFVLYENEDKKEDIDVLYLNTLLDDSNYIYWVQYGYEGYPDWSIEQKKVKCWIYLEDIPKPKDEI